MGCVLGIDPGLGGALAFLDKEGRLLVRDVPTFEVKRGRRKKRELNQHGLQEILSKFGSGVVVAYVEVASARPGQGTTSMFAFGFVYGSLRQAVVSNCIALEHVTPQVWRKVLRVRKGKDASRMRASELMPKYAELWSRAKDHGRAEAALIAYYGAVQRGYFGFPISSTRRGGRARRGG